MFLNSVWTAEKQRCFAAAVAWDFYVEEKIAVCYNIYPQHVNERQVWYRYCQRAAI